MLFTKLSINIIYKNIIYKDIWTPKGIPTPGADLGFPVGGSANSPGGTNIQICQGGMCRGHPPWICHCTPSVSGGVNHQIGSLWNALWHLKMGGGLIFKRQGSVTMHSNEIQSDAWCGHPLKLYSIYWLQTSVQGGWRMYGLQFCTVSFWSFKKSTIMRLISEICKFLCKQSNTTVSTLQLTVQKLHLEHQKHLNSQVIGSTWDQIEANNRCNASIPRRIDNRAHLLAGIIFPYG